MKLSAPFSKLLGPPHGRRLAAPAPAVQPAPAAKKVSEARPAKPSTAGRFIAGPWTDSLCFIFSPLLALAAGAWMAGGFWSESVSVFDTRTSLAVITYMTVTQAHIMVGFVRSHMNRTVFKRFPLRFTLGPLLLVLAVSSSDWIWTSAFVLMTFWDVYHSSMQTFGLGRIYDAKLGNDALAGRRLDQIANLLIYVGPILAGAALMSHIDSFDEFGDLSDTSVAGWTLSSTLFTAVPPYVEANASLLRTSVLAFTAVFAAVYVLCYRDLRRKGYRLPWQKACLLGSTAVCAVFAWGYNSFGMAFLIMNLFHAVQYFALVWITERRMLGEMFRTRGRSLRTAALLVGFLAVPLSLGMFLYAADGYWIGTVLMACALLHFWFDGFMWSVRKRQAV